jgi:Holin of 3TMs, for gene-transfer release
MEAGTGKGTGIGGFLTKILGTGAKETIDSIGNTIDRIDKSDEKLEMQLKYKQLLMEMEASYINYESKLLESQSKIIESEAKGDSWLQRNWRPLLMVICMFIILNNYVLVPYFGIPVAVLDDHIWTLMEMGVTGYVAGRSLEKISENLGPVLQNVRKKRK